jgi:hypothetical protein
MDALAIGLRCLQDGHVPVVLRKRFHIATRTELSNP